MKESGSAVGSFLSLFFLIAAALDFAVFTCAMITECGDLGFTFAFGGRVGTVFVLEAVLLMGG